MASEHRNAAPPLQAQGKIKQSRLSKNLYTISLLNEGLYAGILNSQEVHQIQSEFMSILKDLIKRYTQGKSSSVASDTAESILASILYATDANLRRFDHPEQAVDYLKTVDTRKIYGEGIDVIRQCFDETKRLYREVKSNKLDVAVEAYHATIDEALPVFLKKYGIIFDAHNTMASIDYPLAIDDMQMEGVFYIRQYMERLKMETHFCRLFSQHNLQELLVHFGKICGFDYRIELFNIFELTLNNAVFSVLSGGEADQVRIAPGQFAYLTQLFTHLNATQIRKLLHEATDQLQAGLTISDPRLIDYMHQCIHKLVQRVINASEHNSLQTVIIKEKEEKRTPRVVSLEKADRMTDSHFRLLIEKIMACEKTQEKVNLIQENVHSLADYVDVLNAHCLFGNEFKILFKTMGDIELAILAKKVFYEELRGNSVDFSSLVFQEKTPESEWEMHYMEFLQSLNQDRITVIEECIHDIDYEEITFY